MRTATRIAALLGTPIAALTIAAGVAGPAMASTGPATNGQTAQQTGHNNAAKYIDPVFGQVQCNETQHPQFDTVSCKFMAGQTQAPGAIGSVGWNSDFQNSGHTTGVLNYTINLDGTGYTGQATYPQG